METQEESEVCTCALLDCVGNCFYTANCKHLHPKDYVKKSDEALKPKKKALKLGNSDFKPVEESKTGNTTQASTNQSTKDKALNTNATEFDPYKFTYSKQFEEAYLPDDLEDPEGFEGPMEGEPMGEHDDDIEDEYYFHGLSANCDCCKGLINACDGQICQIFGYCHCYATEIEEKKFLQHKA